MSAGPRMQRAAGFSLIELMVSIAIGLLAILFATKIMTDSERNKDGALGGSDSMQNGMMAMFSLSADAEQAGFGLNDPIMSGCDTDLVDADGYELETVKRGTNDITPLAPVVIVNGGSGPDRISFHGGGSPGGTISAGLSTGYSADESVMSIDRRPYVFTKGDVLLVAPTNGEGRCVVAQISKTETVTNASGKEVWTLAFNDTADRYNSGNLGRDFSAGATRVFNLGQSASLSLHTWQVKDNVLRVRATNMGGGGGPQPVADNIVSIKAQYGFSKGGFDLEAGVAPVEVWSNDMIDADGEGGIGSVGDYQRVVAVRLAVVARNRTPERPGADGKCSATTEPIKVFESAQPSGIKAVPVTLDLDDAKAAVPWSCYRYRAFETIVPLRNTAWSPAA